MAVSDAPDAQDVLHCSGVGVLNSCACGREAFEHRWGESGRVFGGSGLVGGRLPNRRTPLLCAEFIRNLRVLQDQRGMAVRFPSATPCSWLLVESGELSHAFPSLY